MSNVFSNMSNYDSNKGPELESNLAQYEYEAINYLSDLEPFEGNLFWAGNFSSGSTGLNGKNIDSGPKRDLSNAEFRIQSISTPSISLSFTENQVLRRNFFTGITRSPEVTISWIEDAYMSISKYHQDWLCNWYDLRHDCFICGPAGKYRKLDIYLYHYTATQNGTMKPQIIAQYQLYGLVPVMTKYPDLRREGSDPIISITYKVGHCDLWFNTRFLNDVTQKVFTDKTQIAKNVWSPTVSYKPDSNSTTSEEAHRLAHAFALDLPAEGSLV